MNKEKAYPEERLIRIMENIKKNSSVDVDQLTHIFNVTGATIRADLRELERRNLVMRTHGGAILRDTINDGLKVDRDPSYDNRILQNVELKERIGAAVANLINDGDSIMLDDGSTTLQIAKKLPRNKNITVVTNGLNICLELSDHSNIEVIATGGMLNKSNLSFHGRMSEEVTERFHANKAILGASGITVQNGVTAPDEKKAELKKTMIKNSSELIIVADHTKLTRVSLFPVCAIDKVCTLVTDYQTSEELISLFREHGVNVIIV